jgi:hypothetical protein
VVVLASSVLLTAQNVVLMGALGGRVTDQSGAVMTGASGLYRFLALTPGSYSIAVSLKGFRNVQAGPVRVADRKHRAAGRQTVGGSQWRYS